MSTARDQLFLDLFTTALEGGINYWSQCSEYHWCNDETEDVHGFYAEIVDVEDDGKPHRVDRSVIAKGYGLATTTWTTRVRWSTERPPLVVTDDTDWDFDAGDADVIVQLGLFNEVIYG